MDEQILQFFDRHPDALPLYEKFEKCVEDLVPEVRIKVQKTQTSLTGSERNRKLKFGFVKGNLRTTGTNREESKFL